MVLAAGQGMRLRPATEKLPKALVPVAGRPMIEYPLRLLRHYGIDEIVINLHYLGEQIEHQLGDGRSYGLNINYSREPELLDTGGGLLKAKAFLQGATFVVINTDALIDLNLAEAVAFHRQANAAVTLVVRPDARADQYGSMDIDADGRICRFLHSNAPFEPKGTTEKLMFTGVQVLEPEIFSYLASTGGNEKFSTTRHTYPQMLISGERLFGYRFDGYWQDLGTPERIREAEHRLASGQARLHFL